jgi:hypothetical protein
MSPLFGLWKRVCRQRGIEGTREERLAFENSAISNLKSPIASWKDLGAGEISRLVSALRRELASRGADADRRASLRMRYVLYLAPRVYGAEWDAMLHGRLERAPYLFYAPVTELDGRRMHGLIEEMLDRLARSQESGVESRKSKDLRQAKEALRKEMIKAVRGARVN